MKLKNDGVMLAVIPFIALLILVLLAKCSQGDIKPVVTPAISPVVTVSPDTPTPYNTPVGPQESPTASFEPQPTEYTPTFTLNAPEPSWTVTPGPTFTVISTPVFIGNPDLRLVLCGYYQHGKRELRWCWREK